MNEWTNERLTIPEGVQEGVGWTSCVPQLSATFPNALVVGRV